MSSSIENKIIELKRAIILDNRELFCSLFIETQDFLNFKELFIFSLEKKAKLIYCIMFILFTKKFEDEALKYAVIYKRIDVIEFLLANGANPVSDDDIYDIEIIKLIKPLVKYNKYGKSKFV